MAAILSDMDGRRTLAEIIRRAEHETCRMFSEREILSYIDAVLYLSEYGYVKL